jgi:hypothetical protein
MVDIDQLPPPINRQAQLSVQPNQLHLKLPDLLIQAFYGLLSLHFFLLVTTAEYLGQLIERLFLPFVDLVRWMPYCVGISVTVRSP